MDMEPVVSPPSPSVGDSGNEFANSLNSPSAHETAVFKAELGKLVDAQREFTAEFYRQEASRNTDSHKRIMDFLLTQERANVASIQQEQLSRTDGGSAPTDSNGKLNPNALSGVQVPVANKKS